HLSVSSVGRKYGTTRPYQLVEDMLMIVKKMLVLEMIVDESLEMIEDESLDMIVDETLKLDE
ncbi:hypothetical protein Tco_0293696, partial [Tanacetum coccineum]